MTDISRNGSSPSSLLLAKISAGATASWVHLNVDRLAPAVPMLEIAWTLRLASIVDAIWAVGDFLGLNPLSQTKRVPMFAQSIRIFMLHESIFRQLPAHLTSIAITLFPYPQPVTQKLVTRQNFIAVIDLCQAVHQHCDDKVEIGVRGVVLLKIAHAAAIRTDHCISLANHNCKLCESVIAAVLVLTSALRDTRQPNFEALAALIINTRLLLYTALASKPFVMPWSLLRLRLMLVADHVKRSIGYTHFKLGDDSHLCNSWEAWDCAAGDCNRMSSTKKRRAHDRKEAGDEQEKAWLSISFVNRTSTCLLLPDNNANK